MSKEDTAEMEGTVTEAVRGGFRVRLDGSDHTINATISGRIRKNHITIVVGDQVRVEVSPYDLTRGRITFRLK